MKIQIFDGGTFQEIENVAAVSTFGELKTTLAENNLLIDYDTKSVVVKPGNVTLELDDAAIPTTDTLTVFLFPKRTKSGSNLTNFITEVANATLNVVEREFDVCFIDEDEEMIVAEVMNMVLETEQDVEPLSDKAAELKAEYDRIGRSL